MTALIIMHVFYEPRMWLMLTLSAMFCGESFVYTVIDAYMPKAFADAHSWQLSILFGVYSACLIAGLLLSLLLHLWPPLANLKVHHNYWAAAGWYAAFTALTCIAVWWPASFVAFMCQRSLLGLVCAMFVVHTYKGVARGLQPNDALTAITFINAGLVAGDAVAPILGNTVYPSAGLQITNAMQPAVCAVGLLMVLVIPFAMVPAAASGGSSSIGSTTISKDTSRHSDTLVVHISGGSEDNSSKSGSTRDDTECDNRGDIRITDQAGEHDVICIGSPEVTRKDFKDEGCQNTSNLSLPASKFDTTSQFWLLWNCLLNRKLRALLFMLALTQGARCMVSIQLPVVFGPWPMWVVPSCFAVQALCALMAPFSLDMTMRRCKQLGECSWPLRVMSVVLAASAGLLLPVAQWSVSGGVVFRVLMYVSGGIFGSSYAAVEVLVFHYINSLTATASNKLAIDFGAILYILFYELGNLVGGLVAGALAAVRGWAPMVAMAVLAIVILVHGTTLAMIIRHPKKSNMPEPPQHVQ